MKKSYYPSGLTLVFWAMSAVLAIMGVALIVYAKQTSSITHAIIGSVTLGLNVFFALLGFLYLKGEVSPYQEQPTPGCGDTPFPGPTARGAGHLGTSGQVRP